MEELQRLIISSQSDVVQLETGDRKRKKEERREKGKGREEEKMEREGKGKEGGREGGVCQLAASPVP